ncbi:MAG: hypothetical protein ACI89J_002455 [Hyphomicrobiaceae bacterium]|jgi:hypothetical protein
MFTNNRRGYDPNRTWEEWLLTRSRQLAFVIAMLLLLIVLMIFGPSK